MDCKIDGSGSLLIKRGKEYRFQWCPHDSESGFCGDWCPYFNEHEKSDLVPGMTKNAKIYITHRMVTTCAGIDMELKGDDR